MPITPELFSATSKNSQTSNQPKRNVLLKFFLLPSISSPSLFSPRLTEYTVAASDDFDDSVGLKRLFIFSGTFYTYCMPRSASNLWFPLQTLTAPFSANLQRTGDPASDSSLIQSVIGHEASNSGQYPVVVSTWPFVEAVRASWRAVDNGFSVVDAVVEGCWTCEELRCDGTVGPGGSSDENGETTFDALVMDDLSSIHVTHVINKKQRQLLQWAQLMRLGMTTALSSSR